MIRYDPTLVSELTSNCFALCTNVKVYLYNYSYWVELSMNIHGGKGKYSCSIEIIKGLTDKGQFQYLIGLKGPQEGTYLYTTQFLSLR